MKHSGILPLFIALVIILCCLSAAGTALSEEKPLIDSLNSSRRIVYSRGSGLAVTFRLTDSMTEAYRGYRIAALKCENMLMYFVNGVIDEAAEGGLYPYWISRAEDRWDELESRK